jgi:YebC/PmpR family DNA-binding regulatory protein
VAGHSKWANIKRRKGAQDAVRGKLFTKLIKEIMVAAKMGGPDLDANARLRLAVDKAKSNSMPRKNIERAIAKAAGEAGGENYENLTYEGYGPAGVAVLVECLTDNRNRTSSDVKHAFSKSGGNLGAPGSVAYQFSKKAVFSVAREGVDEDTIMMAVLEAGGDDVSEEGDEWVVVAQVSDYETCRAALLALGVELKRAEITQIPDNDVAVSESDAKKVLRLLDHLDDLDDVQETYTNADLSVLEA